jgi:hypothetical protein
MNEKNTSQETDPTQLGWLSNLRSQLDKNTFVFQIADRFFEGGQLRSDAIIKPTDGQTGEELTLDGRRFIIQRNGTFVDFIWGNIKETASDDTTEADLRHELSNVFVPERRWKNKLVAVAPDERASFFAEVDLQSAGIKKTRIRTQRSSEIQFIQTPQAEPDQIIERLLYREEQIQANAFKEYYVYVNSSLTYDKEMSFLVGEKSYVFKALARYDVDTQKLKAVHLRIKVNGKEFRVVYSPDNEIPRLGWEVASSEHNEEDLSQLSDFLKPDLLTFQQSEAILEFDLSSLHPAMPELIKLRFPVQGIVLPRQYGMLDAIVPEFANLRAAKS